MVGGEGEQDELMKEKQSLDNPASEGNSWVEFNNMTRNSILPEKVYHVTQICGGQKEKQGEWKKGNSFEICNSTWNIE